MNTRDSWVLIQKIKLYRYQLCLVHFKMLVHQYNCLTKQKLFIRIGTLTIYIIISQKRSETEKITSISTIHNITIHFEVCMFDFSRQ